MANQIINLARARSYSAIVSQTLTASPGTFEFENLSLDVKGMTVTLDLTGITTAASLQVTVYGVDRTSGKTWQIGQTATITAVSTVTLAIHPSNPTAAVNANGLQTQQGQIPPFVRVAVTQGDANATTYSLGVAFTS